MPGKSRHAELVDLHRLAEHVNALGRQARAILTERLPDYADLHFEGAQRAAEDGDTRPAEWALTHLRPGGEPVAELPQKAAPADGGGVKILVSVPIGGLPANHS